MNKPSNEMLQAAAQWWADQLTNPKFDNLGSTRGRNAKETRINDFASMLATVSAAKSQVDQAQLDSFKEAIVDAVNSAEWFDGCLYVDYGPDRLLSEAAARAGIDRSRFPWKSGTWMRDGQVTAACGYGAPREIIFPKETSNA